MTTDISPASGSASQREGDAFYDEHYRTYRGFVLGVGLFAAHVAVILLFLAAWLLWRFSAAGRCWRRSGRRNDLASKP